MSIRHFEGHAVFAESGNMPFWFDAGQFNRRIAEFAKSLNGR